MLELKSKNLLIKSGNGSQNVISKVLDFYDLIGKNILLLHYSGSTMSSWVKFNKQEFSNSSLKHILSQHLFRLDILVVDSGQDIEENYRTIRQITDLPVIFLVDIRNDNLDIKNSKGSIKIKNFDTAYILSKKSGIPTGQLTTISSLTFDSDRLEDYLVESIKEEWKSNLKELKIQYIRDKNLRDLLGEDE
jgi:hypothetical protein